MNSPLKNQILEDIKSAMKAKDTQRLGTLRLVSAAIKQKEVDERIEALSDSQVVGILDKLVKQRKDSIEAYEKANRPDLAAQEALEQQIISAYLPQRMSAQEIAQAVAALVEQSGAKSAADMGKVMALAKSALAGKADMGQVSAAIKAALS